MLFAILEPITYCQIWQLTINTAKAGQNMEFYKCITIDFLMVQPMPQQYKPGNFAHAYFHRLVLHDIKYLQNFECDSLVMFLWTNISNDHFMKDFCETSHNAVS